MIYNIKKYWKDKGVIPDWLYDDIPNKCRCGAYILMNENMTQRFCLNNAKCQYTLKYRAEALAKFFGFTGVGPETCETLLVTNDIVSHFTILGILKAPKKKVFLGTILELAYIKGIATSADDIVKGYNKFEAYFRDNPSSPILPYKDMLIDAQKYFEIMPYPDSQLVFEVALTNSVNGFKKRENFIDALNHKFGKYLRVKLVGKRETKRFDYLVSENPKVDTPKAIAARGFDPPIPIVTSEELICQLSIAYTYYALKGYYVK